jgi:hypothetical protein
MPRKDTYHDVVRNALLAEGWNITHDPYPLKFGEEDLYVDLGAEAPLAAEKEGRKIAVEVKTFLGRSPMTELERALGQFTLYRFLLQRKEPDRALYLAVTETVYDARFDTADARDLVRDLAIRFLIFDLSAERILRWIE